MNSEDLAAASVKNQIVLGSVEEMKLSLSGRPPMRPEGIPLSPNSPEVLCSRAVWQTMSQHADREPHQEVGGVMLGNVYEETDYYFVVVSASISARWTEAGPAHLKFTGQSWLDILNIKREKYPETHIVGWYHSHPGWGIFLSGADQFIHRHFFHYRPWYIAVVVDPRRNEQGCFRWRGDVIERNDDIIWLD